MVFAAWMAISAVVWHHVLPNLEVGPVPEGGCGWGWKHSREGETMCVEERVAAQSFFKGGWQHNHSPKEGGRTIILQRSANYTADHFLLPAHAAGR